MDDLVRRVADGDRDAFERLYRHHSATAFHVANATLHDHAHAEEVTQEVFLEVWRTAAKFEPGRGSAGSWISTMARHRAIDRIRAVESARARDRSALRGHVDEVAADPEELCVARHRLQVLRGALDRLPRDRRAILLKVYVEGLSQSRIAAQLGIPLGTVKSRVAAALRSLREHLEADESA